MISIAFFTLLFCIVTVISILLMGSRDLIGGTFTLLQLPKIIFRWEFILGAFFAFLARLFFVIINNKVYKIPALSASSTTITALITSIAMIFVIIANYFFLGERLNVTQGMGAFLIIVGVTVIMIK
ncbi:MAG: hypothetical protein WCI01_05460 [Chlorobiaceae bacterium]